jgi:hypothetical protein
MLRPHILIGLIGGLIAIVVALLLISQQDLALVQEFEAIVEEEAPSLPIVGESDAEARARLEDIAEIWAPIIYQDVHEADPDADFITNVDFDGDWFAYNNWENQDDHELKPFVYYWVFETASHWFIGFGLYHPRDWGETGPFQCLADRPGRDTQPSPLCHENDLEGILLVVEQTGPDTGRLQLMGTIHHGGLSCYVATDAVVSERVNTGLKDDRCAHFGEMRQHDGRPIVYSEGKGHALYGDKDWDVVGYPGLNGVTYYPEWSPLSPPAAGSMPYAFKSMDELWSRRCDSNVFALGGRFNGDDYDDNAASAPWAWSNGPFQAPDFFLDPSTAVQAAFELPKAVEVAHVASTFDVVAEEEGSLCILSQGGSSKLIVFANGAISGFLAGVIVVFVLEGIGFAIFAPHARERAASLVRRRR